MTLVWMLQGQGETPLGRSPVASPGRDEDRRTLGESQRETWCALRLEFASCWTGCPGSPLRVLLL